MNNTDTSPANQLTDFVQSCLSARIRVRNLDRWVICLLAILLMFAIATPAMAFERRIYAGFTAGGSMLRPETANTGFTLTEEQSAGADFRLGWDFSARFALEAFVAELGEATVSTVGNTTASETVAYSAAGASILSYFYNRKGAQGLIGRYGMSLFAGLGVGQLRPESDLPTVQNEDTFMLLTVGAELGFHSGLAARIQLNGYDTDALTAQLGVIYRFGDSSQPRVRQVDYVEQAPEAIPDVQTAATAAAPVPTPVSAVQTIAPAVYTSVIDSDQDGVADTSDRCPASQPGQPVDASGCALFDGTISGLLFESDSALLGATSQKVLSDLANQLQIYPQVRVAVMAHTDSSGNARKNLELSKQRALSVSNYLVKRGVDRSRIRPQAFGESQPIADNSSPGGRQLNRRIELRTLP